jgi:hypothetical protein
VGLFHPERETSAFNEAAAKVTAVEKNAEKIASWSTVARKDPKGVLTRCCGYKTALWQKMVFKVNLD